MASKLPYEVKRYLSRYEPTLRNLIGRSLLRRMEDGGKPRWEDLFGAIDDVFSEFRAMPFEAPEQDPETQRVALEQFRNGNSISGEQYLNEARTAMAANHT